MRRECDAGSAPGLGSDIGLNMRQLISRIEWAMAARNHGHVGSPEHTILGALWKAGDEERSRDMLNVCPHCGDYQVEREIIVDAEPDRGIAICGACGARLPFTRRPLFVVTGASGTGKTATCLQLMTLQSGFLSLESDILWGAIDVSEEAGVERYWNAWLRMVKNINQGPQSVILFGTLVPETLERQPERRYIGETHYLSLVADPEVQEHRLRARPAWRKSDAPDFIDEHVRFNRWLIDHATSGKPQWDVLDTTSGTATGTADEVLAWVSARQDRSAARTRSSLN